jgi:hypothetical protein
MPSLRLISVLVLGLCVGCTATTAQTPRVRVLDTELPRAPRAEPVPASDVYREQPEPTTAPRLGAPGGSGAGSRRVTPARSTGAAQSGNDTVGGLPAGTAGFTGPLG